MIKINENFLNLQQNYLFSTIHKKVDAYKAQNPNADIINLGIGDVTRPIPKIIVESVKKAMDEMGEKATFKGYGPECGYEFLRQKIAENDYKNLNIDKDEIFISDGAKCDTGNIVDIFSLSAKVAIADPVYPVYLDSNVICGRTGQYNNNTGRYEKIIYINLTEENKFEPSPSQLEEIPDLIYLCSPNNPTGVGMKKETLKLWVDYAITNKSIILFDAAYEAFIEEDNIPHSIYEIDGADKVAIEFKSYSKTAGFTGLRCAYTVIPKRIEIQASNGEIIRLNEIWKRRSSTKFNGVSYIIQRGAEAIYSEEGKKQVKENILYYKQNAKIMKNKLEEKGIIAFGGINSPYIWLKIPENLTSWEYFDKLLTKYNVVGTPGVGFGRNGEGYLRLTAFGDREKTIEAIDRIVKN